MRLLKVCLVAVFALPFLSVEGAPPVNTTLIGGIAIKGYDPVSYFTDGKAEKGSKKYAYEYNGATWRFSSEENRSRFIENPGKYAPQYGGYCAWAVSEGYTANIDPKAWKIVDGKLYLNYSQKIKARWEENQAENIVKADANWPALLDE